METLKWEQVKSGTGDYLIMETQHKMMIVAALWVWKLKTAGTANVIHTTGYLKAWKCKQNSSCPCVCLCNVYSVWSSSAETRTSAEAASLIISHHKQAVEGNVSFRPLNHSWCRHLNEALALFRVLLGSNMQRKGEDAFPAMFSAGIYCLPSGMQRGKPEQKL